MISDHTIENLLRAVDANRVYRGSDFQYRRYRTPAVIDDVVYAAEDRGLLELLPKDGAPSLTSAGQQWLRCRTKPATTTKSPQFVAANRG